ncbi:unknown [Clostridium sp. CAG:921]|nr:unknown [Clostridium sp. CAG:921]
MITQANIAISIPKNCKTLGIIALFTFLFNAIELST